MTAIKHHWWWKVSHIFEALPVLRLEPEALPVLGLEPEALPVLGLEPEALPVLGLEPEALPVLGLEPEALPVLGLEPEALPVLGLEPEALSVLGKNWHCGRLHIEGILYTEFLVILSLGNLCCLFVVLIVVQLVHSVECMNESM